MTQKSLRSEILERLHPRPSGAKPAQSRKPAARALTESKPAASPFKKGQSVLYQGRPAKFVALNESNGMMTVKLPTRRDPIFVRPSDVKATNLNEGFLGIAPISPTWVERRVPMFRGESLTAADIGLDVIQIDEDDDTGEPDDQEEDSDNGSNIRHDGHTGKTEVDALPTPSDTIAPAYSDEKPPKEEGTPLSIEKGAEPGKLWQQPDWDGYDFPEDAPDIPTAEFPGSEMGNARAPDQSDHHDAGENLEKRDPKNSKTQDDGDDEDDDDVKESRGFSFSNWKKLISEMDDLLGPGEDTEPGDDATITVSLPAMASIVCTSRNCQDDEMLRAMIEALAEVGKGKTIEMDDLMSVAAHVNGEEYQEVENRDAGRPDHEGMSDHSKPSFGGPPPSGSDDDDDHESHDHEKHGDHEKPDFGKHDDDDDSDDHDHEKHADDDHGGREKLMGSQDMDEAIDNGNPNSGGQGHDPDHQSHPLHGSLTQHGYRYSHSTPIHRQDGSSYTHHTYQHGGNPEHKVGVSSHQPDSWDSTTSPASGRRHAGSGGDQLGRHLQSKQRRHGLPPVRESAQPVQTGFYGVSMDDIVRNEVLSEEDEMREFKRRAGLKFW